MTAILVVDHADSVEHTAFVNTLADRRRDRIVAHACGLGDTFAGQVLAALGRRHERNSPAPTAHREQLLAATWLKAERRVDLFVYGAWRLSDSDIRWVCALAADGRVNCWLITHCGQQRSSAFDQECDANWEFDLFRSFWDRRRRRRRPRHRTIEVDQIPEPIADSEDMKLPWPYLVPAVLGRRRTYPAAIRALRTLESTLGGRTDPRGLAHLLLPWLTTWKTPLQRAFLLAAARDSYFRRPDLWLEWTPDLLSLPTTCRSTWARKPDPNTVSEPALTLLSTELRRPRPGKHAVLDADIHPNGAMVIAQDGTIHNIQPVLRPAVRACYALDRAGELRPNLLRDWQAPSAVKGAPSDPVARGKRIEELAQVAGALTLSSLHSRGVDNSPNIEPLAPPPEFVAPTRVSGGQARVLGCLFSHPDPPLAQPDPVFEMMCYPNTRNGVGTLRTAVEALEKGGLVERRRSDGTIVLAGWLRSYWVDRRVTEFPRELRNWRAVPPAA